MECTMNGFEAYQDASITTQSKGNLIVMLYDGAVKFLKLAVKEIDEKDPEAKGKYIVKAQNIINELNTVLDLDAGGEIAANLRRLYLFMNQRLSEANLKQDPQKIKEVITLLEELNQSWKAIAN